MTGLVLIFILSIIAWAKGDDSMKGFVIIGVIFLIIIYFASVLSS